MSKPNQSGELGGLSLSFGKEDIQISIQPTIFAEYLIEQHGFSKETADKVAEDFFVLKLLIRNKGSRTRVQLNGDKVFNILRVKPDTPDTEDTG